MFIVLFDSVLCLVYPILSESLDCPVLIAPSFFSNVYFPVVDFVPCTLKIEIEQCISICIGQCVVMLCLYVTKPLIDSVVVGGLCNIGSVRVAHQYSLLRCLFDLVVFLLCLVRCGLSIVDYLCGSL